MNRTVCIFSPSLTGTASWVADVDYSIVQICLVGNAFVSKDATAAIPGSPGIVTPNFLTLCCQPQSNTIGSALTMDLDVALLAGETVYLIPIGSSGNKCATLVLRDLQTASIETHG